MGRGDADIVSLNDGKLYGVDLRFGNKATGQLAVSVLPYANRDSITQVLLPATQLLRRAPAGLQRGCRASRCTVGVARAWSDHAPCSSSTGTWKESAETHDEGSLLICGLGCDLNVACRRAILRTLWIRSWSWWELSGRITASATWGASTDSCPLPASERRCPATPSQLLSPSLAPNRPPSPAFAVLHSHVHYTLRPLAREAVSCERWARQDGQSGAGVLSV